MTTFNAWAKLSITHRCTDDIKSARAMYEHMDAQMVENGHKSDIIELVPQGGPRSGKLFALFNSGVPSRLRKARAGTAIGELDRHHVRYFHDDSMVLAHSVDGNSLHYRSGTHTDSPRKLEHQRQPSHSA